MRTLLRTRSSCDHTFFLLGLKHHPERYFLYVRYVRLKSLCYFQPRYIEQGSLYEWCQTERLFDEEVFLHTYAWRYYQDTLLAKYSCCW